MEYFVCYIITKNLLDNLFIPAFFLEIHQAINSKIMDKMSSWGITTDEVPILQPWFIKDRDSRTCTYTPSSATPYNKASTHDAAPDIARIMPYSCRKIGARGEISSFKNTSN